jgi:hypothetical protein
LPLWAIVLIAMAASAAVVAYVYAKTRSPRPVEEGPAPNFRNIPEPEEPAE